MQGLMISAKDLEVRKEVEAALIMSKIISINWQAKSCANLTILWT